MTHEEFLDGLERKGYSYEMEKGRIRVLKGEPGPSSDDLDLDDLESIPPGVIFSNDGFIFLDSISVVPEGTEFRNSRGLYLESIKRIEKGAVIKNLGGVFMSPPSFIDPSVRFENGQVISISKTPATVRDSMYRKDIFQIEGMTSQDIMNSMIESGLFT